MSLESGYEERRISERVASLEAANEFNKESLQEISNTLKEVVKTQTLLANQRDELLKISDSVSQIAEMLHRHDKELSNIKYRLAETEKELGRIKDELKATQQEASNNAKTLKIAIGGLTSVVIPTAFMIIKGLMGW